MSQIADTPVEESERKLEIERLLDHIVDPCSVAVGNPIGLLRMGIVEAVEVRGQDVAIRLLPTFPGCLYTAVFAAEIDRRLGELVWPRAIDVQIVADGSVWDEDRMAPGARQQLEQARDERRRRRAEIAGR
jgi:metal-sulfur cluster biosynthetic enzyme